MIREEKIKAVGEAIKSYTTMPWKFVIGDNQGSSFMLWRSCAAVLLYEDLGFTYQQVAEALNQSSHSTARDLVTKARSIKHPDRDPAELQARPAQRLPPAQLPTSETPPPPPPTSRLVPSIEHKSDILLCIWSCFLLDPV